MSKITRCDGCGKDIDGSGRTFRLITMVDLQETRTEPDFCSLPCVSVWAEKKNAEYLAEGNH